jgi:pimeloyl-ACP methyl ester carboxylesterase
MKHPTFYRTTQIDGLSIFYREAGPNDAPALLLLHGLPSSSRMFEPLLERLSDRYHLVAPDYPGFGHSDWPDPEHFAYTFDRYAEIINHFTEALGLRRYTLYMQDHGGAVGFRMALAHPDRIEALILQNAVAHNEGLGANWKPWRAFWADRTANESTLRTYLLSLPMLVIWGKYDLSFDLSEPEAYRRDVPNAQVYVLDARHVALDTAADEIAALIRGLLGSSR